MVDFNNETTIARSATEVVSILILEARKYAQDAGEVYIKAKLQGTEPNTAVLQSRIWTLWNEVRPTLKRRAKNDPEKLLTINTINESIKNDELEYDDLIQILDMINDELDDWRLTRIDGREAIDRTRVENENKAKNL